MSRKRILFVEQSRQGTVGGSHHSLLLLVQRLDRAHFEPVVAFYEPHVLMDAYRQCARVVMLPAHEPVHIKRAESGDIIGRLALLARKAMNLSRAGWASLRRMRQVRFDIRPDIIHLNNCVRTGIEWPLVARLCGARCVVHQRRYARPNFYAHAFDRVLCISRDIQAELERKAPAVAMHSVQIYNGIDVDALVLDAGRRSAAAVRAELAVKDDEPLIVMVGNMARWKGHDVLLRALPELVTRTWQCVFVGGVPRDAESRAYYEHLLTLRAENHLESRTKLLGFRTDVPSIMNAAEVLVHASVTPEPLGRVILEAMALEKPVIAADHGGPREIIEDGLTGFLVPPNDPVRLGACLDHVLGSSTLRASVGARAQARVRRVFAAAEYIARVQEVYDAFWPELREGARPGALHSYS
jgi:glycosyltransferase involved in cell wall biosynthesis